jgi:hypothetical protein
LILIAHDKPLLPGGAASQLRENPPPMKLDFFARLQTHTGAIVQRAEPFIPLPIQ